MVQDSKQIKGHTRSKANPHKVKPDQIGAYALDGRQALTEPLNVTGLFEIFLDFGTREVVFS